MTEIIVDDMGISSLEGINYFSNLRVLMCDGNGLTDIDVSQNYIAGIIC